MERFSLSSIRWKQVCIELWEFPRAALSACLLHYKDTCHCFYTCIPLISPSVYSRPLAGFHYISRFSWSRVSCRDFWVSEMLNSAQSNSSAHIQIHEGCRDESRRDVWHNVLLIILFLVAG